MNYCKEIASFRYNRTDTQANSQRPTVLTRPVQAQIRIKKNPNGKKKEVDTNSCP